MRSRLELYELALEQLKTLSIRQCDCGLCFLFYLMKHKGIISLKEYHFLKNDIYTSRFKPSKSFLPKYTKSKYWIGKDYWWNLIGDYSYTKKIRIKYLTDLIKHLETIK